MAAACLALGLLSVPARAQGIAPGKATPQATTPAPQASHAVPQAAYPAPQASHGTPQSFASGQYASSQALSPCACYYPQGFCPFPSGNCATFPRGNCIAVRPSPQSWPTGSAQTGSPQAMGTRYPSNGVIGD
ncbi:MAG: hypothetical protein ACYC61_28220 [Isosphaeraceae bacterium]